MNIIVQAAIGAALAIAGVTAAVTSARPAEPAKWTIQVDDSSAGVPFILSDPRTRHIAFFETKERCEDAKKSDFFATIMQRLNTAFGDGRLGEPTCRQWNPEQKT